MSGIAFQNVGGLKPGKTRFDWHTSKKFDCDFGQIIPVLCKQVIPGDYWNISAEALVRCKPLVYPTMHECSIDMHAVFIPIRILDDCNSRPGSGNPAGDPMILKDQAPPANRFNWELFITGGYNGLDKQALPRWNPSNSNPLQEGNEIAIGAPWKGSLWDFLDLPTMPDANNWMSPLTPLDFIRRGYNLFYNEFMRDETLIPDPISWKNEAILQRAWRKDYFTSALPFRQRGVAPAIPVNLTGVAPVVDFNGMFFEDTSNGANVVTGNALPFGIGSANKDIANMLMNMALNNSGAKTDLGASTAVASSIDVNDLRQIIQLQKFLERNARAGYRLNEFILAHFGEGIGDARLWRPEYIGGSKTPLIISEVLQTSESATTPQGEMAGHGISVAASHLGNYKAVEHGLIYVFMTVMPAPAYQQGIDKDWLYETRFDYFFPEFANLSEMDIIQGEIFIEGNENDKQLFGYQGHKDELRVANSKVCNNFRDLLADWHLGRIFTTAPALNRQFIEVDPIACRRIFADQSTPVLLCDIEFNLTAVRPIPEIAEPGLMDHH